MVLIKRLARNDIPESPLCTACAIGKFNFNNLTKDFLVASSSELIYSTLPANRVYKKCLGAEVVRQQDDGSTVSIGKIEKIHPLARDVETPTTAAAVLISIEDSTAVNGIFRVSNSDTPRLHQEIQISTETGMVDGSIVNLNAEFQPVSAEKRGIKVVQAFEVSVEAGNLDSQDSGSPVLTSDNKLLGMFVMARSSGNGKDRAFCVKTETLIFV